jgi:hypothetical protein
MDAVRIGDHEYRGATTMSDLGDEMIAGMERFPGHLESGGTIDENQKPRTARELLGRLGQTGVVGMWKDRTDIGDSAEFATKLRKRASGGRQDDGLSPADFARLVAWFPSNPVTDHAAPPPGSPQGPSGGVVVGQRYDGRTDQPWAAGRDTSGNSSPASTARSRRGAQ